MTDELKNFLAGAVSSALVTGSVMFIVLTPEGPPVRFSEEEVGDMVWQCRLNKGNPTVSARQSVKCVYSGKKATPEEALAESRRQDWLLDKRKTQMLLEELERSRMAR